MVRKTGWLIGLLLAFVIAYGFTKGSAIGDQRIIENLIRKRNHISTSRSINRYVKKHGTDAQLERLQVRWYKQLKKDYLDSSLFAKRRVIWKRPPSLKRCFEGKPDSSEYTSFRDNLNFVRLIAGVPPVQDIDPGLSQNSQRAAWCLSVNNKITHSIPKSFRCYTPAAALAASKANLSIGYSAGTAILGMLRDEERSNISVGHRRWLLHPPLTFPGYGLTNKVAVIQIIGEKANFRKVYKDLSEFEKRPITWPVAGVHPMFLATKRFSISLSGASFRSARVSVTRNGRLQRIVKHRIFENYGSPTLVFDMPRMPQAGEKYLIRVSNVRRKDGTRQNFTYTVLFKKI